MPLSLTFVMIHNGELEDSPAATVRDNLCALADELGWSVTLLEVQDQPPLPPAGEAPSGARRTLARFAFHQRVLEHRFRRHLGANSLKRDSQASLGLARDAARLASTADVAKKIRIRLIEEFVTQKHIRAAQLLLDGTDSLALVAESDATWLESTPSAIRLLLESDGPLLDGSGGTYVNLAGGLMPGDIGLDESQGSAVGPGVVEFHKASSNTSCAYLMNRTMAALLVRCAANRANQELGVDWLFNLLFMTDRQDVRVWHCRPPILGHGSITGSASSWHPDRQ